MHGVVEAEGLDVWQLDSGVFSEGNLAWIVVALEGDETRPRRRLDEVWQRAEGKTDPGNHDGPALDAAVAVDALFERRELEDLVHGEFARFLDLAAHGNGPGRSHKFLGILGGLVFVHAELVEIVVMRYVVEPIAFFAGAKWTFDTREFRARVDAPRRSDDIQHTFSGHGGQTSDSHAAP